MSICHFRWTKIELCEPNTYPAQDCAFRHTLPPTTREAFSRNVKGKQRLKAA